MAYFLINYLIYSIYIYLSLRLVQIKLKNYNTKFLTYKIVKLLIYNKE